MKNNLMKRYEAETSSNKCIGVRDYYIGYISWLEAQLTWRPVGEKPKEGQIVFATIPTGWVVAQYLHGKFYTEDGFTFGDLITGVTHWLPIPPKSELLGGK